VVGLLTRSRPSVGIDLKHDAGRALVLDLAEQADILIEGFRPGVAERLGLGPEECGARNQRLVYGRMTGWARMAHWPRWPPRYRLHLDGRALWSIGRAGERPVPPLNLVGDFAVAHAAAFASSPPCSRPAPRGSGRSSTPLWSTAPRRS